VSRPFTILIVPEPSLAMVLIAGLALVGLRALVARAALDSSAELKPSQLGGRALTDSAGQRRPGGTRKQHLAAAPVT
jgi:hypothetical protein